ncbi:MAG: hypothetical protein O2857_06030 [Planctomycetota bacterium]|nr:hypothetical protein [Planctomycetota bacterium]
MTIQAKKRSLQPRWAIMQRYLIEQMNQAAIEFVRKYTHEDGTLIWRDEWPGMDGSDDGYESFLSFPMLYLIGGSENLLSEGQRLWEAVTRQFTEYGQIHNEYDGYYDWMHHGESGTYFHYLCMSDPKHAENLKRADRFSRMYTGEDPEVPNYDPALRMMRSPINGSRGPCFEMTADDWSTHRPVLAHYPAPYEDVPGHELEDPTAALDWDNDAVFAEILKTMNARMVPGDVPLNLNSTSLIGNSFMLTGEEKYRRHVADYVTAWQERTDQNGGITPDNIGPSGQIGERMNGNWWGGYYGWRWPHGAHIVCEALLIGAQNAALLTGDLSHLDLPRSQLDMLWSHRIEEDGVRKAPSKYAANGWYGYGRPHPNHYIHLYNLSQDEEDLRRIEERCGPIGQWPKSSTFYKAGTHSPQHWLAAMLGKSDTYAQDAVETTLAWMNHRLDEIRKDEWKPEEWDVHHWQNINPVIPEGLLQMSMGSPSPIYHGGLMHARIRYFDPEQARPGLPQDVAAFVDSVTSDAATVQLVNTNLNQGRTVTLQGGAFGEHQFIRSEVVEGEQLTENKSIDSNAFTVELPPGTEIRLHLGMKRFANKPTYEFPDFAG